MPAQAVVHGATVMHEPTRRALRAVDQAFYRDHAHTFAATRTRPWSAFSRIVGATHGNALTVLDAGCGNGRFAQALVDMDARVERYVGVDESAPLLRAAEGLTLPFPSDFVLADLLEAGQRTWFEASYSLVVCLGVLHHVPFASERQRLVQRLSDALVPGGILALSFFRFERSQRIVGRLLHPSQGVSTAVPLELEPGDYLMPFGHTGAARYCHMFDDAELDHLAASPTLQLLDRFSPPEGTDRLNEYLLLRRPGRECVPSVAR